MQVTVKSEQELLEVMGNKLYGYTPSEDMNTNDFVYPVTFVTNEKNKTFKIKPKKKNEEVKVTVVPSIITEEEDDDKFGRTFKAILITLICVFALFWVIGAIYTSIN